MNIKVRDFLAQLAYVPQTLRLIWTAAPAWTLAWACLLVIQGLLPAATVYLTRLLVDRLTEALGEGLAWQNIQPTLLAAVLMAAVMLLTQVLQSMQEWVRIGQAELIRDQLTAMVHEKSVTADLAYYESPEYHDRLHQASQDLKNRPLTLLESSGSFIQSAITLISIGVLLVPYGIWVPLILTISILPAFYVVLYFDRLYHRWWERTTVDRRWAYYYDAMLTLDVVASEVRLFNLGSYFQSAYQSLRRRLRTELLHITRRQGLAKLGAGAFAALLLGAAMAWMVWQAFLGVVTLGDIALFYQALSRGQSMLRTLLDNAGRIYSNTLFLENLFKFLDIEPQVIDPTQPAPAPERLAQGIRFREVTFYYPGSERPVFDKFDLVIPAGKIVAVVGSNGAGKTTLVKLLCRLYDPAEGAIEFDNIDIRNLTLEELRRLITGMFQFPVHYFSSVSENIAMGDLAAPDKAAEIERAGHQAGAHDFITRLPQGYDTLLGKLFPGGVELSGGEWQRLALARSFFRQAPIMVLDEPTSFMDSWSEVDWFERFRELARGRTAILITHRFTIARKADIIHVMEAGQIVESGSHEELLALDGRYAQSWLAQTNPHSDAAPSRTNGTIRSQAVDHR